MESEYFDSLCARIKAYYGAMCALDAEKHRLHIEELEILDAANTLPARETAALLKLMRSLRDGI